MRKILITSLSVYWVVAFGLAAIEAGSLAGSANPALAAALSSAHTLVALLFLWTALAMWSSSADDAGDVARLAFAAAVLMLAVSAILGGQAEGPFLPGTTAIELAALAASYLVIRGEEATARREHEGPDYSHAVARHLAVGAAHGSMLSRLSQRGLGRPEGEA